MQRRRMNFNNAEAHAAIALLRYCAGERETRPSLARWEELYGQPIRAGRMDEILRLARKASRRVKVRA